MPALTGFKSSRKHRSRRDKASRSTLSGLVASFKPVHKMRRL